MKKTIVAIMIMAIVAMSCFAEAVVTGGAESTQAILLTGGIAEAASYSYTLQVKNGESWVTENQGVDLTDAGYREFKIVDTTAYRMKAEATRTLTISVVDFKAKDSSNNVIDELPLSISAKAAGTGFAASDGIANAATYTAGDINTDKNGVEFTATYVAYKNILATPRTLGTFTVKWDQDTTLAAGDYEASVTLTIAAR